MLVASIQSDQQSRESVKIMDQAIQIVPDSREPTPATVLHVGLIGVHKDDGRLQELIDRIDEWVDDSFGITPMHTRKMNWIPPTSPAHETGGEG